MGVIPSTGVGINTHAELIPTPNTYFPNVTWIRCDDIAAVSWTTTSLRTTAAQDANYPGKAIARDLDSSWGTTGIVGHARDIASTGRKLILGPNEPDLNGISGATYAAWMIAIKRDGLRLIPGVQLGGPQLSTWSLSAASAVRVWWDEFVAAGGLDAIDVVCIHPYTTTDPTPGATITAWIADLRSRIGGKQLVFTEFGYQSAWVIAAKGSWSAANEASLIIEAINAATAGGVPMLLYDGPYSLNNDGNAPLISTTVLVGSTGTNQNVASTANMVQNMFLALSTAVPASPSIRQILTIPDSTHVTLTQSVTTTNGATVVNKDHNSCLTYWASGVWNADGTGLTALGTALAGVI